LQLEADDHGALGLSANGGARLVRHLDDVGRIDDDNPVTVPTQRGELAIAEQRVELPVMTAVRPTSWIECAGSSSLRASSAPATVAWGAKSPPMASNAMRAKAKLPWLRPAAYRRNTRIRHTRDADAWEHHTWDMTE
jgi:hypothetical protein